MATNKPKTIKELRCDTCGKIVSSVSRVVIDENYDRSMSRALYNCSECYDKKEAQRRKPLG
jgi:uncharacterized protein with PIN domain